MSTKKIAVTDEHLCEKEESESFMYKLATFIVDKRNLFFLLFIFALIFCFFAKNWVKVENDITTYVQALIAKISTQGLTFIELLQNLATYLGYSGVELGNYEPFTVNSTVDERLYSEDWIYFVRMITVDEVPVREFTVDSTVNKALAEWGNQLWECMVKALAPAHLSLIFQYGED